MSERHAQSRKVLAATCGHVCVQLVVLTASWRPRTTPFSHLHLPVCVQHGSVLFPVVWQRQVSSMSEVLLLATLDDVPVVLRKVFVQLGGTSTILSTSSRCCKSLMSQRLVQSSLANLFVSHKVCLWNV